MLMWKNTFKLDIISQKGSLHLDGHVNGALQEFV